VSEVAVKNGRQHSYDGCVDKFLQRWPKVAVHRGDQSNTTFLNDIVTATGGFDIIVDDGGHMVAQQVTTFLHYFLGPGLRPGGVYIVEDLHSNYMTIFGGKPRGAKGTFMDLTKSLLAELQCGRGSNTPECSDNLRLAAVDCVRSVCAFYKQA